MSNPSTQSGITSRFVLGRVVAYAYNGTYKVRNVPNGWFGRQEASVHFHSYVGTVSKSDAEEISVLVLENKQEAVQAVVREMAHTIQTESSRKR